MKCTFTIDRESSLVRKFAIRLEAADKPIRAVDARFDDLSLARDEPAGPVTTFERLYRKDQGNSPGRHELFITAEFEDGTIESFVRIWQE